MRIPLVVPLVTAFLGMGHAAEDAGAQTPTFQVEVEAGPAWLSSNDVEIPNDGTATRFSLVDVLGTGPWPAGRVYATWNVAARHGIRVLLAPLSVTETGRLLQDTEFQGSVFRDDADVEATYTFNSYRLSYRWQALAGARGRAWIGLTAKVRDATVALLQGVTDRRKDNVGFVPLLHLAAERHLGASWHLSFDADALAGGPGRAIDAAVKVGWDMGPAWSLRAGYRTVEGGADVEEVYNFAWLHYGVVSLVWQP